MSSEYMCSYDFSVFIGYEFAQTVRLSHTDGFSIGSEQSFFSRERYAALFAFLLGESHHTGFWTSEDSRRNGIELYSIVDTENVVDYFAALKRCGVGKHAMTVYIAYGIDPGDIGSERIVGFDSFGRISYTGIIQPYTLYSWASTYGNQDDVGLGGAFFTFVGVVHEQLCSASFNRFDGSLVVKFDTPFG